MIKIIRNEMFESRSILPVTNAEVLLKMRSSLSLSLVVAVWDAGMEDVKVKVSERLLI